MPRLPRAVALAAAVADLAGDGQRLLVELDGLARLAQGGVGNAQVAERGAFAAAVADLAGDRPAPARSTRWPCGLAQGGVGNAQVAEVRRLRRGGRRSRGR